MYWLNKYADLAILADYEDTSELRPLENRTLILKFKVINDLYIVRREGLRNMTVDISNAKGRGKG